VINDSLLFCCTEVRDLLRTWREDSERRSKDVVDFWENTLMGKIDRLGNESIINRYTYYKIMIIDISSRFYINNNILLSII